MASEKIRNIIKSKVNSAISLARKQVEQYGRGKLNEINKQLEDPKTLVDVLLVNVIALPVKVLVIFGIISPLLNTCLEKIIIYYCHIGNELLANNYILFNHIN